MPSPELDSLLEQASDLLVSLNSLLTSSENPDQQELNRLLSEHHQLFKAAFAEGVAITADDQQAISQHLAKMQHLIDYCQENKDIIAKQIGSIRRSEKVNKAYGK